MEKLDQLLLHFILELSNMRDPQDALRLYSSYLSERFQPSSVDVLTYESNEDMDAEVPFYREVDNSKNFLFPWQTPQIVSLKKCKAADPSPIELDSLAKALQYFKDKLDTFQTLKSLSYTDDITGLYNHRYLEVILDRELALAKRQETTFSILFLDLDLFKTVNATYGHLIGSRLLHEVGKIIQETLRETDVIVRYGGDEFVMILTYTSLNEAMVVAERVRKNIDKTKFLAKEGLNIHLTASIGVASYPDHAITKSTILKAADEAMFEVKKDSRNRVTLAKINPEKSKKAR